MKDGIEFVHDDGVCTKCVVCVCVMNKAAAAGEKCSDVLTYK